MSILAETTAGETTAATSPMTVTTGLARTTTTTEIAGTDVATIGTETETGTGKGTGTETRAVIRTATEIDMIEIEGTATAMTAETTAEMTAAMIAEILAPTTTSSSCSQTLAVVETDETAMMTVITIEEGTEQSVDLESPSGNGRLWACSNNMRCPSSRRRVENTCKSKLLDS